MAFAILIVLAPFSAAMAARESTQDPLVLAISEGSSGGIDAAAAAQKYAELAAMIGKTLDRQVSLEFVRKFSVLEEGGTSTSHPRGHAGNTIPGGLV